MQPGDTVRFRDPCDDERGLRFVVVEPRGDRVMVRHADSPMSIKPTFVYRVADLERIACYVSQQVTA